MKKIILLLLSQLVFLPSFSQNTLVDIPINPIDSFHDISSFGNIVKIRVLQDVPFRNDEYGNNSSAIYLGTRKWLEINTTNIFNLRMDTLSFSIKVMFDAFRTSGRPLVIGQLNNIGLTFNYADSTLNDIEGLISYKLNNFTNWNKIKLNYHPDSTVHLFVNGNLAATAKRNTDSLLNSSILGIGQLYNAQYLYGQVDSIRVERGIGCSSKSANFTYTDNGNGNYTFTNTSTGVFYQSHWAFGDGTTSSATSLNHTFSSNGTFVVVLTINDSLVKNSCIDYHLDTINVTSVPSPSVCAAGFVMYPDTTTGNIVVINSSTGTNLSFFWNFGDGNTSAQQSPTHNYSMYGPFILCLTVNDGAGCINTYCDSIGKNGVVFNKQAGFTINVISISTLTGLDNNEELIPEINIFPNPASYQLLITNGNLTISEISIVDITGALIKKIPQNINTVSTADLSNGIYFITVVNSNGEKVTRKFIKQ